MTTGIFLGLGGNIGNVQETMQKAKVLLEKKGVQLKAESSFYKTEPIGPVKQDDFINQVIQVQTELEPIDILKACLEVEQELGRERKVHWGPRTIDIDVLLYGQQQLETDDLILPHPRMHERRFVLVPLAEIAPEMIHPKLKKTAQSLLDGIPASAGMTTKL